MQVDKILIVTDGIATGNAAVAFGFSLANDLQAAVLLLGIINPSATIGNPDAGIFPDDALVDAENHMTAFLLDMKAKYAEKTETLLLSRSSGIETAIAETADKWQAGLVVLSNGLASKVLSGLLQAPVCFLPA